VSAANIADLKAPAKSEVSKFYFGLAIASVILLIGTAALTTLHYLKFEHKQDYTDCVSFLPIGDNK